jgi:urea transport system substrate-binding protein
MTQRLAIIAIVVALALGAGGYALFARRAQAPIRVGLLHSLTGAMRISEKSMIDGEMLAIDEINASGGVLGRRIEPIVADGESDWPTYARRAADLIGQDVKVIFGCWTSASRKTVKPVIEAHKHLLVYPMAYEGLEESPYIIYTGAAPNQQIFPAVKWSFDHLRKSPDRAPKFFLVGSDYVWPHSVNAIVSDQLKVLGAEKSGEAYIFFGSPDVAAVVQQIRAAQPDVILSTVVGDTNKAFYPALKAAGIIPAATVVSMSIGEDELRVLPIEDLVGQYSAWSYLQSVDRPENREFVDRFKKKYGQDRVTSDVIETSYFSVKLWAQAAQEAGTAETADVRQAMLGQSMDAPEGVVSIDPATRHTWRSFLIGQVKPNGHIEIVWTTPRPIRPVPYPLSRSQSQWDGFLADLFKRWNGNWANPVPTPSRGAE